MSDGTMKQTDTLIAKVFRQGMVTLVLSEILLRAGALATGILVNRFIGMEFMAAFQLASPFISFLIMGQVIFKDGLRNVCARAIGAGLLEKARKLYSTALFFVLVFFFIIVLMVWFGKSFLVAFLGATGSNAYLAPLLGDFLLAYSVGFLLNGYVVMNIVSIFLMGERKKILFILAVQISVEVVCGGMNALYFHQGLLGMGIANIIGNLSAILVNFLLLRGKQSTLCFRRNLISFVVLREIVLSGLPSAFSQLLKTVKMFVLNKTILAVGTTAAVVAFADINTLDNIFNPIIGGVGTCLLSMTCIFFGERDRFSLKQLLVFSFKDILRIQFIVAAVAFFAAPYLIQLFIPPAEVEVYDMAVGALRIYVLYLPLRGINQLIRDYYNGIGNVKMLYVVSALENMVCICIMAIAMGHLFGIDGMWWAFLMSEVLVFLNIMAIIAVAFKKSPLKLDSYLCLPDGFGIADDKRYAASATTMEEVVKISGESQRFCKENGASSYQALIVALSIEEMGRNIIQWGIGKHHNLDIGIFLQDKDVWTLRIRDNTGSFDPVKWLALHQDDDRMKNIGIRTVCRLAKDIDYVSVMGMNNLTIKIGGSL